MLQQKYSHQSIRNKQINFYDAILKFQSSNSPQKSLAIDLSLLVKPFERFWANESSSPRVNFNFDFALVVNGRPEQGIKRPFIDITYTWMQIPARVQPEFLLSLQPGQFVKHVGFRSPSTCLSHRATVVMKRVNLRLHLGVLKIIIYS